MGYPLLNPNLAMTSNNNHNVDKNSFIFLFNEDIYVIPEGTVDVKSPIAEEKVKAAPSTVAEKKAEPEKKIPAIPKIPVITSVTIKDYAVVIKKQEEFDAGKEFLGKILGAIKLDFNKVDLYPSLDSGEEIITQSKHKYIIAFGLDAGKYQQEFNKVTRKNKTTFLFSNDLSELQKDVEKKKALWGALQQFL